MVAPASFSRHQVAGRDAELHELAAFARGDRPPAVFALIQGAAGVGKTSVWEAVVDDVAGRGVRVLAARATSAETAHAYAVLGDLLGGATDCLPALPGPQRRALAAALGLDEDGAAPEPRLIGLGALALLAALAEPERVLVAVDDWQWVDEASAAVLWFVVRRLAPGNVGILVTARAGEADDRIAELIHSLPADHAYEVPLEPLDRDAIAVAVRGATGRRLSPPEAARIHDASRGNPLTAIEIARAAHDGMAATATDVRRLLSARVATLPTEARAALQVVAALAEPSTDTVEAALGADAGAAIEAALAADVIERDGERFRASHPLLADAVRERVSPSAWRALHRRVAAIVQHPEQRALHLSEAATGPDEPTAAALDEAARHAAHRGAPASAADLYERAARLTPADAGEARLQRELAAADAHARSGDAARVEALLRPVAEHVPRGPARARVLYRLAFACGDATVLDLALQALDEADETDNRLLSDIQLLLAGIMYAREGVTAALPHAQAAAAHGERADDPALRSRAYVRIASLQYALGNGVQHALLTDAAALEAAGGPAAGFVTAAIERAAQLGERGHIDQAREILVRELARARADANAEHEWVAYGSLVEVEIRAGRLDLAAAYAAQCRELGEAFAMHNCVAIAYALDAYVEAHRGAEADARARADEALRAADEISDELTGALARHALGLLELSLGNGEPAVEHLTRVCDVTTRLRVIEPGQRAFVPDLAEALVLAGDPGRAATVQAAFEHDARALAHATATAAATRARGLIAGAAGNHGDAVAAHREALALLEHAKHPFEHARTLLALGSEHRRAKERAAARRTLDNARAAFAAMGATLWTERAQSELDRIGGRRARDRDELTATEERVARLAAEGQRNREIAATLFITERTVEANLTRAYRKLGVRSRTELARQLSAE